MIPLPRLIVAVIVLAVMSGTGVVYAQDTQTDKSATPTSPPTKQDQDSSDRNKETTKPVNIPDEFDPSEEISEDLAVPFPTDI